MMSNAFHRKDNAAAVQKWQCACLAPPYFVVQLVAVWSVRGGKSALQSVDLAFNALVES